MPPSWAEIDRWLMGEAWVGSRIDAHLSVLCEQIGVRWAGSDGEQKAAEYIANQLAELTSPLPVWNRLLSRPVTARARCYD